MPASHPVEVELKQFLVVGAFNASFSHPVLSLDHCRPRHLPNLFLYLISPFKLRQMSAPNEQVRTRLIEASFGGLCGMQNFETRILDRGSTVSTPIQ